MPIFSKVQTPGYSPRNLDLIYLGWGPGSYNFSEATSDSDLGSFIRFGTQCSGVTPNPQKWELQRILAVFESNCLIDRWGKLGPQKWSTLFKIYTSNYCGWAQPRTQVTSCVKDLFQQGKEITIGKLRQRDRNGAYLSDVHNSLIRSQ